MSVRDMTVAEVRERINRIQEVASFPQYDHKDATRLERNLWNDVLYAIANNDCDDPAELAAEAWASKRIEFHRS